MQKIIRNIIGYPILILSLIINAVSNIICFIALVLLIGYRETMLRCQEATGTQRNKTGFEYIIRAKQEGIIQ